MSPLERLGLEVVAFTLLGSRMTASLLVVLLDGNGRTVSNETLAAARQWRRKDDDGPSLNGLRTRICILRSHLDDLGFPGVIKTIGKESRWSCATGYSLPEPGRTEIINRLIEEAEYA